MRKSLTISIAARRRAVRAGDARPRRARATSRIRASCWAGNAVRLLRNGAETFPAWLAAIEAARVAHLAGDVHLQRRRHRPAVRGRADRARPGAASRCGCSTTSSAAATRPAEFFERMRAHGVHVIAYHRYRFWRPRFWALLRRNHRKTLVCDGRIAFAGGLNIANDGSALADGGGDWHDAVIQVEGPGGRGHRGDLPAHLEPAREEVGAPGSGARSRAPAAGRRRRRWSVISNSELRERFAIRRAALHAIRESTRRVYLANPYFVPDRGVLRALQRAGRARRRRPPAAADGERLDRARPGGAGRVRAAAGGGRAHLAEPRRRPHQGAGGRRRVRVDRQLQLRPPLARLQPGDGRQRRSTRATSKDAIAMLDVGHRRQRGADARRLRPAAAARAPARTASPTRSASGSRERASSDRVSRRESGEIGDGVGDLAER